MKHKYQTFSSYDMLLQNVLFWSSRAYSYDIKSGTNIQNYQFEDIKIGTNIWSKTVKQLEITISSRKFSVWPLYFGKKKENLTPTKKRKMLALWWSISFKELKTCKTTRLEGTKKKENKISYINKWTLQLVSTFQFTVNLARIILTKFSSRKTH